MKISLQSWLLAAALSLAGTAASTFADDDWAFPRAGVGEEIRFISDESTVTDPGEISVLTQPPPQQAQQDNVGSGLMTTQTDDSSDYLPTSVGSDFYTANQRGAGFIGGGELVFIRPYATTGIPDLGFKASYRAWVGYQNAEGLGGRIRYWSYDQGEDVAGLRTIHLDFQTLDAELTQQVDYYSWNFLVSGGVRQADTRFALAIPSQFQTAAAGFSGAGLTFSVQATRDLNASGSLRFLAGARWSTLFGNSRYEFNNMLNIPLSNTTVNILEINAGPQFVRELPNGALLTIFGGVETQNWGNGPGLIYEDIGFLGFGSSISILR